MLRIWGCLSFRVRRAPWFQAITLDASGNQTKHTHTHTMDRITQLPHIPATCPLSMSHHQHVQKANKQVVLASLQSNTILCVPRPRGCQNGATRRRRCGLSSRGRPSFGAKPSLWPMTLEASDLCPSRQAASKDGTQQGAEGQEHPAAHAGGRPHRLEHTAQDSEATRPKVDTSFFWETQGTVSTDMSQYSSPPKSVSYNGLALALGPF